jgi:hypothetical protein
MKPAESVLAEFYDLGRQAKAIEERRLTLRATIIDSLGPGDYRLGAWDAKVTPYTELRLNRDALEARYGNLAEFLDKVPKTRLDVKPAPPRRATPPEAA